MKKVFLAISLLTIVFLALGCSRNVAEQQPKLDISGTEIEEFYNSSANLPQHNTVCFPTKKIVCTSEECIANEKPSVFILIESSIDGPLISRCDNVGCDTYKAIMEKSGEFVNAQAKDPRGLILKISFLDNESDGKNDFVEVVTLGLSTQVSYGYCKAQSN